MGRSSIGRKLAVAVAAAVLVSGVATASLAVYQDLGRFLASRREALLSAGHAFSAAIASPLAAGSEAGVFAALRGIGGVPRLLHATARDSRGTVLADIGFGAQLDNDAVIDAAGQASIVTVLRSRTIGVTVPVVDAGREAGSLELLSDAGDLFEDLVRTLAATLAGTGIALVLGLAVAARLQRSITRPLRGLTAIMGRVRDAHDYSLSLPAPGTDEVGILISGFNAMLSDIRDRDQQLVRHRDRLEEDVRDRTRDLATAKETAEQANAAKTTFLATMSHEIRTPMTGLLVMAELLATGDLPARSRRYAEVIAKSGAALLAIINDILDFSKIEAGKLAVERVPVDIRRIIGTVVDLFHARAAEKGLDLAASVAADVPESFLADPVRLQQIVGNLVNNALKFTPAGHVLIGVERRGHAGLAISVSDTGIGIESDKLDTIFEAFSQADGTTTRKFGGTGLGLSISNRLAAAMGGRLSVARRYGAGATFTCELPAIEASPAPPWPRFAAERAAVAILAVSGAATRAALGGMLTDAGLAVELADPSDLASGGRVAELLVADEPALRALRGRAGIRTVVALAGSEGADLLADVVLPRPVLAAEFAAVLERTAGGGRGDRGTPLARHAEPLPAFGGAAILVADDTAVNREVMVEALGRFGIVPDLAANGREALEAAAARRYDLILLDGSMPEVDGFEACRRLRAREIAEGRPRTPVMALTAHVVGEIATAWRDAGMDGILHKPFTMAELGRCLKDWLGEAPRGSEAPGSVEAASLDAMPAEEPLLDPAVLEEIAGLGGRGHEGFAIRVFGLYLEHAPEAMARIRAAAAGHACEDLASAAHALKSMSLNIGARQVGTVADAIEEAARAGSIAQALVDGLERSLAATLAALRPRLGPSAAARAA